MNVCVNNCIGRTLHKDNRAAESMHTVTVSGFPSKEVEDENMRNSDGSLCGGIHRKWVYLYFID